MVRSLLFVALVAVPAPFPLTVQVSPNPMPYDHPGSVLIVHAKAGVVCSGRVVYNTKRKAVSFKEQTVKSTGLIRWRWHEETKGTKGAATVTCRLHGTIETKTAAFVVTH